MGEIPQEKLAAFCRRWQVAELAVFGSAARGDSAPESDVDLLVEFGPGAEPSLWDWVQMKDELEEIFGRPVDLVSKAGLRNPFRKKAILEESRVVYAA